jgi:hypothetical protein
MRDGTWFICDPEKRPLQRRGGQDEPMRLIVWTLRENGELNVIPKSVDNTKLLRHVRAFQLLTEGLEDFPLFGR